MIAHRPLPFAGLLATVAILLLGGCGTTSRSTYRGPLRAPITYAIVLYLKDGETLDGTARLNALSLARDTLLAASIVTPTDRLIDDVERAQHLFRARVENGVVTEIAGVPTVSNATSVVLSRPSYVGERVFWDASYPLGYPGGFDRLHGGFPLPGPGWGHPSYGRGYDRRDVPRDRDRDRDQRDRRNLDRGDRDWQDLRDRERDRDRNLDRDSERHQRPPRRDFEGPGVGPRPAPPTVERPQPPPSPRPEPPPPAFDRDHDSGAGRDNTPPAPGAGDRGTNRRDRY